MHIIINGGGKVGSHLAAKLINNGHTVSVIEMNPAEANKLSKELPPSALIIVGDGCDSAIQMDAGSDRAEIFASVTGRDDDNLVACEIAMSVNGVPRCVARVNNPKNERIFRRLGIDSISSTTIIARLIEEEAMAGTMQAVSTFHSNDIHMITARIPSFANAAANSKLSKKIREVKLPKGSLIVAIKHEESLQVVSPDMIIYPGDEVVLVCEVQLEDEAREMIANLW